MRVELKMRKSSVCERIFLSANFYLKIILYVRHVGFARINIGLTAVKAFAEPPTPKIFRNSDRGTLNQVEVLVLVYKS